MSQLGIIYQYELKKILKRKMFWSAFCGVMLIIIFLCLEPMLDYHTRADALTGETWRETEYDSIMEQQEQAERLNGRVIDDTLLQEMQEAYARVQTMQTRETAVENDSVLSQTATVTTVGIFSDEGTEEERRKSVEQLRQYKAVYDYVCDLVGDERVHTVNAAAFYEERRQQVEALERSLYLTEWEKAYWREHEARTPYAYYWNMGSYMMLSSIRTILALITLMIGMVFSGVFADERMRKTDQLVLCSRYGRGRLYLAKLMAAATLGTGAAFLAGGTALLCQGILYGYEKNWNAPIQIYLPSSPFALTMGEAIVLLLALLLLAAMLHSILALVLSGMTKSGVATISLMVVYTLGTMVVNVPERLRVLSQCLYLVPARLVRASALCDPRLAGGAGHYLTCLQVGMLLYPLLTLGLALLGWAVYRRWQISGR